MVLHKVIANMIINHEQIFAQCWGLCIKMISLRRYICIVSVTLSREDVPDAKSDVVIYLSSFFDI